MLKKVFALLLDWKYILLGFFILSSNDEILEVILPSNTFPALNNVAGILCSIISISLFSLDIRKNCSSMRDHTGTKKARILRILVVLSAFLGVITGIIFVLHPELLP